MARKEFDNTFVSKATETSFEHEVLVEQPDRSKATADDNTVEKPYEYDGTKSKATEPVEGNRDQLVEQPERSQATAEDNTIEF
jgi:hypothetical protein